MEVKAVTNVIRWIASRGDSRTTHAHRFNEFTTKKVESGMGSPDWNVSMVDIDFRKLLWVYCPGHAGVKGNDRADRLAGKATLTSVLLLERSEVSRSLRHYLRAQSQGHHTIDRLEERGVDMQTFFLERTRKGHRHAVRRTLEPFQRRRWGNFRETGWSAHGLFRAQRYHLELN